MGWDGSGAADRPPRRRARVRTYAPLPLSPPPPAAPPLPPSATAAPGTHHGAHARRAGRGGAWDPAGVSDGTGTCASTGGLARHHGWKTRTVRRWHGWLGRLFAMRAAPLGRGAVGRTVSATPTVPGAALKGNGGGGGRTAAARFQPPAVGARGGGAPPVARRGARCVRRRRAPGGDAHDCRGGNTESFWK